MSLNEARVDLSSSHLGSVVDGQEELLFSLLELFSSLVEGVWTLYSGESRVIPLQTHTMLEKTPACIRPHPLLS